MLSCQLVPVQYHWHLSINNVRYNIKKSIIRQIFSYISMHYFLSLSDIYDKDGTVEGFKRGTPQLLWNILNLPKGKRGIIIFNSLQKIIHELSNKPWSALKNNAAMSETFCQTHGVHIPKWEWNESIATWIHQKITPNTNSTSKHITTEHQIALRKASCGFKN